MAFDMAGLLYIEFFQTNTDEKFKNDEAIVPDWENNKFMELLRQLQIFIAPDEKLITNGKSKRLMGKINRQISK